MYSIMRENRRLSLISVSAIIIRGMADYSIKDLEQKANPRIKRTPKRPHARRSARSGEVKLLKLRRSLFDAVCTPGMFCIGGRHSDARSVQKELASDRSARDDDPPAVPNRRA